MANVKKDRGQAERGLVLSYAVGHTGKIAQMDNTIRDWKYPEQLLAISEARSRVLYRTY